MVPSLVAFADAQHGVFSRRQALGVGYRPSGIDRGLRSGLWCRLRPGIYTAHSLEGLPSAQRHRYDVAAGLLAIGDPDVVAGGSSAARLHRLDFLAEPPEGVELAGRPSTRRRDLAGLVLRPATLPPEQVTAAAGLPCVSIARAVLDCGRRLTFLDAAVLVDSALRRGAPRHSLEEVVLAGWNWSGIRHVSRALAFSDPAAESALESVCRVVFARGGLPSPRSQVTLGDAAGVIGRVDFYWPRYATVVEADGRTKYVRPEDLWREKLREERLADAGLEVVRLTWAQALGDPEACCGRIRAAFARGGSRTSALASAERASTRRLARGP